MKTVKKLSRWMRARVLGGALILGYHRVEAREDDVDQACVSPEHFASQMETLGKYARPVSLSALIQCLRQNALPPKSVAVTFDDGYADTLHIAKPILERYDIPATVFICTGYLGREFWWDELERLVMSSQADPRTLRLQVGAKQLEWHAMTASTEEGTAARREFRRAVYQFLLLLDVADQNHAMELIRSWADAPLNGSSLPRAMTEEELLQLADGGLVELGAHTRHHPVLPQLSPQRQREEIQSSKKDLETILNRSIAGFSYPNGRATAEAKRIVRELGFAYACTSLQDVVRPGSDLYELTRFWQQDMDGETFLRWLQRWI